MKSIKILLTAVGCPGASTLIRKLKDNGERNIEIIGVDMKKSVIGNFLCDKFYQVPPAKSENYIPKMIEIAKKEQPDILFVQSSYEVEPIAKNNNIFNDLGIRTNVGDINPIKKCNNKKQTYQLLEDTEISMPEVYYPNNLKEFNKYVYELNYPEKKVCFKPISSKGSRGFRIINEDVDKADLLLNHKPNSLYIGLDEFNEIFNNRKFPKLMLMEFVEGKEYTVDGYMKDGKLLLWGIKTRENIKNGLAHYFEVVEDDKLLNDAKIIGEKLNLEYFVNIQFKGEYLIEINPRVSTFVYQDDFNLPYLGIKHILNELSDQEIKKNQKNKRLSRKTLRYHDQVFWG